MQTGPVTASTACCCSGSSPAVGSTRPSTGPSWHRKNPVSGEVGQNVSRVTMYTTVWCGYCVRLKRALEREGIDFDEVDIEQDEQAAEFVMSVNGGNATVPTVVLPDGTALTNPPLPDLLSAVRAA